LQSYKLAISRKSLCLFNSGLLTLTKPSFKPFKNLKILCSFETPAPFFRPKLPFLAQNTPIWMAQHYQADFNISMILFLKKFHYVWRSAT